MRILIVGGLGYLGSHCARFLSEQRGHEVRILTLFIPPYFREFADRFETVEADVTRPETLLGCCRACDVVLYLAALDKFVSARDPSQALRVSGSGTRALLEEARKSGVRRFVFFSTIHVYGVPRVAVLNEETPVNPIHDYSLSHYAGELYCRMFRERHDFPAVSLRLANGYGAPLHPDVDCWSIVIHDFCRSAVQEGRILLKSQGTQARDFIPIPDILQALRLMVETDPALMDHPVYLAASGQSWTIRDIANQVQQVYAREFGREIPIEMAEAAEAADFTTPFRLDISRLQALGFTPGGEQAMTCEIQKIFTLLHQADT